MIITNNSISDKFDKKVIYFESYKNAFYNSIPSREALKYLMLEILPHEYDFLFQKALFPGCTSWI